MSQHKFDIDDEDLDGVEEVDTMFKMGGSSSEDPKPIFASAEKEPSLKRPLKTIIKENVKTLVTVLLIIFIVLAIIKSVGINKSKEVNETSTAVVSETATQPAQTATQSDSTSVASTEYSYPLDRVVVPALPSISGTVYTDSLTFEKIVVRENNAVYCVIYGDLKYFGKQTKITIPPEFYVSIPQSGVAKVEYQIIALDGVDYLTNCKVLGVE